MAAALIRHSDLVQHQVGIVEQFREFWLEDHFCDVLLKSSDGGEHRAHAAVLSASSKFFKQLLGGSFLEAERVQRGQPVEIAASKAAVSALLDYVYGGQPKVNLEAGLELLRLAEAYDLPKLAGAIEKSLCASLNSKSALQVLQEAQGLHSLKRACEEKVAGDFETCSQHPDFGKLGAIQLARILKREDLVVSREEAVLKGIFNWLKVSNDRDSSLGMLLQLVDFRSISVENLLRLGRTPVPGFNGDHLHREVQDALQAQCRKRTKSQESFRPKRHCLQHWSPDFGASTEAPGQHVLPTAACQKLCWHEGAIYAMDVTCDIWCWKPGAPPTQVQRVVSKGAHSVSGITNLGQECDFSISPTGEIFVTDCERLVSFHNGCGRLVLDEFEGQYIFNICWSPNGMLYVMTDAALQKLEGTRLQTVMTIESLPEDLQFTADAMFVTKEEVIYVLDYDCDRIMRISPAESFKPVVVGRVPAGTKGLFITDGGTIYVADPRQRKVLAIHPGDTTFTEVSECPGDLRPRAVLVQDRSLYVSMAGSQAEGLYEYVLPSELHLE